MLRNAANCLEVHKTMEETMFPFIVNPITSVSNQSIFALVEKIDSSPLCLTFSVVRNLLQMPHIRSYNHCRTSLWLYNTEERCQTACRSAQKIMSQWGAV